MAKSPETVTVRLLAGRTGVGRRGDIVEYPPDEAMKYQALGVVRIIGDAETDSAPSEPTKEASEPTGTDGDPDEPDDPTDAIEPEPDETEGSAYEKRPLRQKRRR